MICTRLRPGYLSVRVGDGSWRSEEVVKKSGIAALNVMMMMMMMMMMMIIIIIIIIIIKNCHGGEKPIS